MLTIYQIRPRAQSPSSFNNSSAAAPQRRGPLASHYPPRGPRFSSPSASLPPPVSPIPVNTPKPDWWLFIACFFTARGESEWVCRSAGREKTVQDYTLVFHSRAGLCHRSPQSNKHMSLLIASALSYGFCFFVVVCFFFICTSCVSRVYKHSHPLVR